MKFQHSSETLDLACQEVVGTWCAGRAGGTSSLQVVGT